MANIKNSIKKRLPWLSEAKHQISDPKEQKLGELAKSVRTYELGQELPSKECHVLIACMPKSGSTFVTEVVAGFPGFHKLPLVPDYGRREQELDVYSLLAHANKRYVAQHHVRYSQATADLAQKFNLKCVVLVRNIFDVCVSMRDHIRNESHIGPMGYIPEDFAEWDDDRIEFFWLIWSYRGTSISF